MSDNQLKKPTIRHDSNPFCDNFLIERKSKSIRVNSAFGAEENILVSQKTGEIKATHVTTYKFVDPEKFVKLFTANIALTFDLTSSGIKAFNVLMHAVQIGAINKDLVALDRVTLDDFLKANSLSLSIATFGRGLSELVKGQIIARHTRQGFFYINPNFVFNGDRIAFTTIIEKKQRSEEQAELNLSKKLN
jgi:hypothetical protein